MGRKRTRTGQYVHIFLAVLMFFSGIRCTTLREIQNREQAREHLLLGKKLMAAGDFEDSVQELRKAWSFSPSRSPADEILYTLGLVYAHFGNSKRDDTQSLDFFRTLLREYPKSPWAEHAKIWANVLQENNRLIRTITNVQQENRELKQTLKVLETSDQMEAEPLETKATAPPKSVQVKERDRGREHLFRAQELLSKKEFDASLNEVNKALASVSKSPLEDEVLYTLGLVYAHPENPRRNYALSLVYLRKLTHDYPKSWWAEQATIWVKVLEQNENLNQVIERTKQVDLEIEEKKRERSK